jgi:hypothetical protein
VLTFSKSPTEARLGFGVYNTINLRVLFLSVEFEGVDDALFIDNHPLASRQDLPWEAIFRPDGGQREQRCFHLSEQDPQTGADTGNRMLFEIRVVDDQWFLDSFIQSEPRTEP